MSRIILLCPLFALVSVGCETRNQRLERLIGQFRQGNDTEREQAASDLGNTCFILGDTPKVRQAVELLESALSDQNPRIRSAAAMALGDIRIPAQRTIKELGKRLDDEEDFVRQNGAWAIVGIFQASEEPVPGQKELVPSLLKSLRDGNQYVRSASVRALSKIAPTDGEVWRAIASLAKDQEVGVRCEVAEAFEDAGKAGKPYLPTLRAMLGDESETVRSKAASSIQAIESAKE
jgi:HEAT repeat protein